MRRDLFDLTKTRLLLGSGLNPEKADLLLHLFRVAEGLGEPKSDGRGFVTFRELQESLVNSQSYVSRQVKVLLTQRLVKVEEVKPGETHHANSRCAQITTQGKQIIEPVWNNIRGLAESLFEGVSRADRETHFQVTQMVRHKLRPYRVNTKTPSTHPVDNIISITKAGRELVFSMKRFVLADSQFTLEESDILVDLYGASKLKWPDPLADGDGFVSLGRLQMSLVHSHVSQVLLSRRIRALAQQEWLEIRKARADQQYLAKDDGVRITDSGIKVITPVWEKFKEFAKTLLADVSLKNREIHWGVNEILLEKLQPAWSRLLDGGLSK